MKVYTYNNGEKAVFINDEKIVISDSTAIVLKSKIDFEDIEWPKKITFKSVSDARKLEIANKIVFETYETEQGAVRVFYYNGEPIKCTCENEEFNAYMQNFKIETILSELKK